MKRSKVFLGLTTGLLAIAGVAAAKAHRIPAVLAYYSMGATSCPTVSTSVNRTKTLNSPSQAQYLGHLVFTDFECKVPAYYHEQ